MTQNLPIYFVTFTSSASPVSHPNPDYFRVYLSMDITRSLYSTHHLQLSLKSVLSTHMLNSYYNFLHMLDLFEFLEIFTHLDCFCFSSFIVTDLLSLFTLSRKFHFRLLLMIKFAANFVFTTGDLLASVVTLFMK